MSNITVLCPCAGLGSRFAQSGYKLPKPLIDCYGKPMIARVIENFTSIEHTINFIFLVQYSHDYHYDISNELLKWMPPNSNIEVVHVYGMTEGACCTALLAEKYINKEPLVIANSDQYMKGFDFDNYWRWFSYNPSDINIPTFYSQHPKWSYCGLDSSGFVEKIVEKEVISSNATVGVYAFKNGQDFLHCAKQMIAEDFRVKNEYYLAPSINFALPISKVSIYNIEDYGITMMSCGTPEDLENTIKELSLG